MEKLLIFLCPGIAKGEDQKLSLKIASRMEELGIGEIGCIQDLKQQHALPVAEQRNMIFINECQSACVQMLMQGLDGRNYLFFDVTAFKDSEHFDIEEYIESKLIPVLDQQWAYAV